MSEQELIELLADKEHVSWARWMRYLFSKCVIVDQEGYAYTVIPDDLVMRWQQQIDTPYSELTEREKESDRAEVAHILPIIKEYGASEQEMVKQLQVILSDALIGGNHLATNLIGIIGPNFNEIAEDYENARVALSRRFPNTWLPLYEQWCCWKALITARDRASQLLASYNGEVEGIFKP